MENNNQIPMLFPFDPNEFWEHIRKIVKEEVCNNEKQKKLFESESNTLSDKQLYKIADICSMFNISKPTIYEWIKAGKLKPLKIRSRVFFLWSEIQFLLRS